MWEIPRPPGKVPYRKGGTPSWRPASEILLLDQLFSVVFRPSPTWNRAVLDAGRFTVSPVRGLRAVPAARVDGLEGAETDQTDVLARFQRTGDGVDESLESVLSLRSC